MRTNLLLTLVSVIFFSVVLLGCAEPKYINEEVLAPLSTETSRCEFEFLSSAICLSYSWQALPQEGQPGELLVRLYQLDKTDGFPLLIENDINLRIQLFMPDMGHGSAPTKTIKLSNGTYQVSRLFFTMPGYWTVNFQILDETGQIREEIIVPYTH
jgi:hypothetical protein